MVSIFIYVCAHTGKGVVVEKELRLVVVLLEAEDLAVNIKGWPASISLAVCLLPTGEHHFIVYHVEELPVICKRLEARLDLGREELLVCPKVEGYRTRAIMFSEIQMIWALVTNTPGTMEEALDYVANYEFALEEGLDPEAFLWFAGQEDNAAATAVPLEDSGSHPQGNPHLGEDLRAEGSSCTSLPQFSSRRSHRKQHEVSPPEGGDCLPSFMQPARAAPRPDFFNILECRADQPVREWVAHPEQDGWIEIEQIGAGGRDFLVDRPEDLYLNKEMRELAVRATSLGNDRDALPSRIRICANILPEPVRGNLAAGGQVTVSRMGYFLYITLVPTSPVMPATTDESWMPVVGPPEMIESPDVASGFLGRIAASMSVHSNIGRVSGVTAAVIVLLITSAAVINLTGNAQADASIAGQTRTAMSLVNVGLLETFSGIRK